MKSVGIRRPVMVEAIFSTAGIGREIGLIVIGSFLIALAAQVEIVLPFSPVPVTGQTFAVLLIAALYGSKRGPAVVFTYLTLGFMGLPVFAGGSAGIVRLAGPTGGYLAGFFIAAYLVGYLSERGWDRRPWTTAVSMLLGNVAIYFCGALWLARFVGWEMVLSTGVLPFLIGDGLKIGLATVLLPTGWKLWGRREHKN